jgi:phospholipid transport system substrate-binding protein
MTPILTRTRRSPLAAGVLAIMFILTTQAAPAMAAQGPTALVTNVGTQGIQALGGSTAERLARLSQLFQANFDIPGIGLFALGRYRSMATPQETQEYFRLYPTFTVVAFNSRLDEYRGAPFRVTGKRKIGGGVTLISSELTPNGGRVQFDWHLIKSGPAREYRISDVTIGGVSMKIALRDQFASWIQNNGGRFDALLAVMRQQIAQSR